MNWLLVAMVVYIFVASALNRYRGNGGAWGPVIGHGAKRALVSAWLSLPFLLLIEPLYVVPVFAMIWAIGFTPGWGAYFDFINPPEREVAWIDAVLRRLKLKPEYNDITGMSLRGLHFTVPLSAYISVVTERYDLLWTAPYGLAMGLVYWAFYKINVPGDRIAQAEFAWGATLAGIYLAMIA